MHGVQHLQAQRVLRFLRPFRALPMAYLRQIRRKIANG